MTFGGSVALPRVPENMRGRDDIMHVKELRTMVQNEDPDSSPTAGEVMGHG